MLKILNNLFPLTQLPPAQAGGLKMRTESPAIPAAAGWFIQYQTGHWGLFQNGAQDNL